MPLPSVAKPDKNGDDPVVFELGFVVSGKLVLFLLVVLTQEGEEGTAVVNGVGPGRTAEEYFVEIVIGKKRVVVMGTESQLKLKGRVCHEQWKTADPVPIACESG